MASMVDGLPGAPPSIDDTNAIDGAPRLILPTQVFGVSFGVTALARPFFLVRFARSF